MAFQSVHGAHFGEAWDSLIALVAAEGSGNEPFATTLAGASATTRDLADAAHCWCMLHARHPGVLEFAQGRARHPVVEAWLAEAVTGFSRERDGIVRLVAAAGPLPSTPGQAESESAIAGQRHALDMLAQSDRAGVAIGAAMALVLDWPAIRQVFDAGARRMGLQVIETALPAARDSATVVAALAEPAAFERAMLFGASQTLAQHRALWQLLEARAEARRHHPG
ncbi:DUF6975 family protein [Sphingomonas sp.]|uniref:DUF6975 family protein n=1 Tax=Sphingomonas sp. TaxID=28214 RepID=UPI002CACA4D5|nr:hypothetical protein [Sphingomonas sp.]HWK35088.1 hypothetical protein [Sphingomonas sp.]